MPITTTETKDAVGLARKVSKGLAALLLITRPDDNFKLDRAIRREIDKLSIHAKERILLLTAQLRSKKITVALWAKEMKKIVKNSHLVAMIAGVGGFKKVKEKDVKAARKKIKSEIGYLENLTKKVKTGAVALIKLKSRAVLYVSGILTTFYKAVIGNRPSDTLVRRIRNARESCRECIAWDHHNKGWIPIGEMAEIGSLICGNHCKCHLEFKSI